MILEKKRRRFIHEGKLPWVTLDLSGPSYLYVSTDGLPHGWQDMPEQWKPYFPDMGQALMFDTFITIDAASGMISAREIDHPVEPSKDSVKVRIKNISRINTMLYNEGQSTVPMGTIAQIASQCAIKLKKDRGSIIASGKRDKMLFFLQKIDMAQLEWEKI